MCKIMNIIPKPQKEELTGGSYKFSECYSFAADKFPSAAKYLSTFLKISDKASETIQCEVNKSLKREEYILTIDQGICITARDEEGIFRALSTLRQLVQAGIIQARKIHDYPTLKNRGVMIDISRGKIPKLQSLKDIIDILRDVKYNQLQLYIDGLFFEYAHFAKHLQGKEYISIEELEEIKAYCKENFIELIATQNGFGHMEKWLELPELKSLGIVREDESKMDTLNPLDSGSLELLDTIYSDIFPYFNSEYVNIGMDEPFSLGMGQTKEICEKEGKHKVYVEYLNKIIKLCNEKYYKTPMFFDDVVFEKPEMVEQIKGNCVVMDWGYEGEMPFSYRCDLLKKVGLRFYVCPGTSTWASFTGRFDNTIYNIEAAVQACIWHGGEGMMLTDWGDGGNPQFIAASFLPFIFGAYCSWNYQSDCADFAFSKKVHIIRHIEAYADTFIFQGQPVSNILHRMANYYLLENQNRFNGTYIWADSNAWISEKPITSEWLQPFLTVKSAANISRYMQELKEELQDLKDDTPYRSEIICNCDMVILMAEFIKASLNKTEKKIQDTELKAGFSELKERFIELWKVRSKKAGYEIFAKRLEDIIGFFEG